jgi:hypothetical protein
MKIAPNEDFMVKNYDKTVETIKKTLGSARGVLKLIDEELTERYASAPASSKREYYSSFPGGLAFHNLHMYFWMKKFSHDLGVNAHETSLLTVALLHEIGKVGDLKEDYYLPLNSDWHYKRGTYYEINPKLQYMRIPHRSLFLAQQNGIELSREEYLAILLHEAKEEESAYKFKLPPLARVTQFAYQWSTQVEKENQVLWPPTSW